MATDTRKVAAGIALLLASSLIIFGTGQLGVGVNPIVVGAATLGLAAGTLLVGTSEDARPV